jgi:hypothetical protein
MKFGKSYDTTARLGQLIDAQIDHDKRYTIDEMLDLALKALIDAERENAQLYDDCHRHLATPDSKRLAELKDAINTQRQTMPGRSTFVGLITLDELETLIALAERFIND